MHTLIEQLSHDLERNDAETARAVLAKLGRQETERSLCYLKAICYLRLNLLDNAREALQQELKLFPDNQQAITLGVLIGSPRDIDMHTQQLRLLNLGCGSRYDQRWTNVDFKPKGTGVIGHDLKKGMPFGDSIFDAVYHSHLLEHFSRDYAPVFLKECHRVLKPGGSIRVVVPDLEHIIREYLDLLQKALAGNKEAQDCYEWIMLELFDQMVRNYSGGEMLKCWSQPSIPAEAYVIDRMGPEVHSIIKRIRKAGSAVQQSNARVNRGQVQETPEAIGNFRLAGEVHQWMYDRYSLGKLLREAGFEDIRVCRADESQIPDFNSYHLDIEPDGTMRKPDSLFMEARKPLPLPSTQVQRLPLRVAAISTSDSGGAGKAAYRLHLGLESGGVHSRMHVASKKSTNQNVHVIPGIDTAGAPLYKKRNEILAAQYPDRPSSLEVFTLAESDVRLNGICDIAEADIVHLHWVADLLDYRHAAQVLRGKKIVWTLHDMNPFTGGCHYAGECTKYMRQCGDCPQLGSGTEDDLSLHVWKQKLGAYKKMDITVVTPSKWLSTCARESALLGRFPVHVIPYGFPTDIFKPFPKDAARAALNIDATAKVVLFGADIINKKRKGFHYLLKALEKLSQGLQVSNIVLAFFGRLPEAFKLTLPYPAFVFGDVSDENSLAKIYSSADVFVLPTLEDNLPNTVMEAMACGTPVVGFDVGGVPDMIDDKKTGRLVVPGDIHGLADGILWVLKNRETADLSRNCRVKALSFSLERQASSYQKIYEQLLAQSQGSATTACLPEQSVAVSAENKDLTSLCKGGEELFGQGRTGDAMKAFEKALAIDGNYVPAHNNMGVVYWQMGNRQKALEHLQKALALNPFDSDTVYNLGEIFIRQGATDKARGIYDAFLRQNPGDARIKAVLERLGADHGGEDKKIKNIATASQYANPSKDVCKQLLVYIDPGFTHDIGHYTQMAASIGAYARKRGIEMLHYVRAGVPADICSQFSLAPLFRYSAYIQAQEKELSKILEDFEAGLTAVRDRLAAEYQNYNMRMYMYTCHPAHLPVFAKVFGSVEAMQLRVYCNLFHIDRDFCNGIHNIYYEHYLQHIKREFDRHNKNGCVHITNESQHSASKYAPWLGNQILVDAQPILEPPARVAVPQAAISDKVVLAYAGFPHERVGYPMVFRAYESLMKSDLAERVLFKVKHVKKHYTPETLRLYEAFTAKTKNIIHETRFLPGDAYDRFLNECDIILIPYSKKQYPVNTSGVLVDALLRKKVVVVPEDTWMAEQIQRYGAGVTFESDNEKSFIAAIGKAVADFPALVENADRNYDEFIERHSVENLFRQLGFEQGKSAEARTGAHPENTAGGNGICPACHSSDTVFIRKLRGQRSKKELSLYQCKDCGSLHNPSGYKEDDKALQADKDFHVRVTDRNEGYSHALIKKLLSLNPQARTLLDVGAGIGTLIRIGSQYGLACDGVEPNRHAVEYAKRNYGLSISCDYYRSSLFDRKFDIITIISVLEHLEDPELLFAEAVKDLQENGLVFVSVPFYNPQKHERFLRNPDIEGTLFFDNDVHVTHFTVLGLRKMIETYNPKSITQIGAGWNGLAVQFGNSHCRGSVFPDLDLSARPGRFEKEHARQW